MADAALTPTDGAADLQRLAAGGGAALRRQIAALLAGDRGRLTAALYRLDVDESAARRLLAAAAREGQLDRAAAGLAELVVRRLRAKMRSTAAYRARSQQDPSR